MAQKVKLFEKLQEALDKMDEFDEEIMYNINRIKELVESTETWAPTTLGALREESIQHEGNTIVNDHPRLLMKKGRLIECYLYSQNHFMRKCPMQGKLSLLVVFMQEFKTRGQGEFSQREVVD
jgi:hypothetical protein